VLLVTYFPAKFKAVGSPQKRPWPKSV